MRLLIGFAAASALIAGAHAQEVVVKDVTISIEPMLFYSGQRNRFVNWGERMDCPTASDRPAGSRDRWIEKLCGDKANRKPVVKQMGGTYTGGSCGYTRYAVACVKVP